MRDDEPALCIPRPGGRSARVQAAVHDAVRALRDELAELSVPAIASRAGVTPSTIYRRWGTLAQLLSDVALERLQPDAPVPDTGSLHGDLLAWFEPYVEEMASAPGRAMIRDLVGGALPGNAAQCFAYTCDYVGRILDRAAARGELCPGIDTIRDRLIAPVIYRLLFTAGAPTAEEARRLVVEALSPR